MPPSLAAMRLLRRLPSLLILTTCLAVTVPCASATAVKPAPERADLTVSSVAVTLIGAQFDVSVRLKNKGVKKAKASTLALSLSTDGTASKDDPVLGTLPAPKLKPGKSSKVAGSLTLPSATPAGSYQVIACADGAGKVKERKEKNNCAKSAGSFVVPLIISATAGTGGSVAVSGLAGGSCTGTACTFPAGKGSVTFTPISSAGYRFGAWTGATCSGYTAGADNAVTFADATVSRACTATFVRQVKITWDSGPAVYGKVSASAVGANSSCTSSPATSGSCLVDAGAGTVTLTAQPAPGALRDSWVGTGACNNAPGATVVYTNPTTDQSCYAAFEG